MRCTKSGAPTKRGGSGTTGVASTAAASSGEGQDDQPAKPSNQDGPEERANIGKVGALLRREEWLVTKRGIKGPVREEILHQGV